MSGTYPEYEVICTR